MAKFVVVDVETTGLNPYKSDRILEIGMVTIDETGKVLGEFASLFDPERDVGPTRIHGLRASDVMQAPRFKELLPKVIEQLDGMTAIVGHNLRFDESFLAAEFARAGLAYPDTNSICTLEMAGGGRLAEVCKMYGVDFSGLAHHALQDARATARLFSVMIQDEPDLLKETEKWPKVEWPQLPPTSSRPLRREELSNLPKSAPNLLQRLVPKMDCEPHLGTPNSAILAYSTLLAQVLADRVVDESEADALIDLAMRWSIPKSQIQEVHRDFLRRVQVAALVDGVVTQEEREDIHRVAELLGLDRSGLDDVLNQATEQLEATKSGVGVAKGVRAESIVGKSVCFTGEVLGTLDGRLINRDLAMEIAERHGLIPVRAVTKQLDFLVAADVMTQSGKARKARDYGIPIWSDLDFWKALGLKVVR